MLTVSHPQNQSRMTLNEFFNRLPNEIQFNNLFAMDKIEFIEILTAQFNQIFKPEQTISDESHNAEIVIVLTEWSDYDVALSSGFKGSYSAWLIAIKGTGEKVDEQPETELPQMNVHLLLSSSKSGSPLRDSLLRLNRIPMKYNDTPLKVREEPISIPFSQLFKNKRLSEK